MNIVHAGWATGWVWGEPKGPPAGSEWYVGIESESDEERVALATHAAAAAANLGSTSTKILAGSGITSVSITLSREAVEARFTDTDWRRLAGQFLVEFESEVSRLAQAT